MRDILYIGGGFDILHSDHKKFIEEGVNKFLVNFKDISEVIVGIKPDLRINNQKGKNRPFFSFEWRKADMEFFLRSTGISFRVINSLEFNSKYIDFARVVSQIKSEYVGEGARIRELGADVLYVDQVDYFHTSDIETRLTHAKNKSKCNIRKVGAILLRDGKLIREGSSGLGNCDGCKKFRAYNIGGGEKSKKVSCDYPHAEEICLGDAIKGDDLIVTDSPCMKCAEAIVLRQIRRVVYLEEYYNLKPLEYLKKHGVEYRKAGM